MTGKRHIHVTVRLSEADRETWKRLAKEEERGLSSFVRAAVASYVRRRRGRRT
jgi:hypothetical protein